MVYLKIMEVCVSNYTLASACGLGIEQLGSCLAQRRSPLQRNNYADSALDTWIGCVEGVERHALPDKLNMLDSRNNRLSDLALSLDGFDLAVAEVIEHYGSHRIGVIVGTSTSSVGRTESGYAKLDADDRMPQSYQQPDVHNPHAPGYYVARRLGILGPCMTISTACSSSTKVFAAGQRWLVSGMVDAVLVGGVDSMCMSILHGFASLELVSENLCRPFDESRDGINIGEAAGFALLVNAAPGAASFRQNADQNARPKNEQKLSTFDLHLTGVGESSDAFHMAQPHPDGQGAAKAMAKALSTSGLCADQIGYINLHGTATPANDLTETRALSRIFTSKTLASSTKGWTGHTLGAAGICGSIISLEALKTGFIPGTLNLENPDKALEFPILQESIETSIKHTMVNSFGFGGNNCSLVFSKVAH